MSRLATPMARPASTSPVPGRASSRLASILPLLVLVLLIAGYAALFGWLSLMRYWAYQMHALDMGNMGQAAWNTVHGHPFQFTNMRLPYAIEAWRTTTRLSFHVEPLFPLISLVYLVSPHPESLLVLQTVALALGAVPIYLLARDALRSSWLALTLALAYLLFPTLEGMNLYEFHPVALATPLLLAAFLFAHRRQYLLFALCCLAAMGTKEEIGLVVALFGLYIAVAGGNRRVGLLTAAVGIAWSLFAVLVVEHHYRQPGTITYFRTRYGYLGHGIHGALDTGRHDPLVFARVAFTWYKLGYLLRLLAPVGFTALLAPLVLLLGLPTLALNLLSTDFHMYSGLGDNSAELIAVVMIAGVVGCGKILDLLLRALPRQTAGALLGAVVLIFALGTQHQIGFVPLLSPYQAPTITSHDRLADRFVAMVPPRSPVSTQDQLDPHLSSRRYLYLFEDTGRVPLLVPASYILLDVSAPTYPLPSDQIRDRALSWIHRRGWGVAAARDGLILIEKGARRKAIPAAFYTYAFAPRKTGHHALRGRVSGLELRGYDVQPTDEPNYRIPNLAYTFYLHPVRRLRVNVQPVIYQLMGTKLIGCAYHPLGLAWFPTSEWTPGRTYRIRMDPLVTDWQSLGTAHLLVEFRAISSPPSDCSSLWKHHGALRPLGMVPIGL